MHSRSGRDDETLIHSGATRLKFLKELAKSLLGPGIVVPIIRGPLAGSRYRMNRWSGLSPLYGAWERESQMIFEGLVHPGHVVYDLGANTGIHTLLFSKLAGAAGRVAAFEPTPHNLKEIDYVIRLNRCDNVEVLGLAVADFDGFASFAGGNHSKAGSLDLSVGGATIEVTVRRLDSLVAEGLPPPDFIKVDIEGGEGAALRGAGGVVSEATPTMYIELHNPAQDVEVGRFLAENGYRVFRKRTPDSERRLGQRTVLQPVRDLSRGWEDDRGIWGCVVAVHPAREPAWRDVIDGWCRS